MGTYFLNKLRRRRKRRRRVKRPDKMKFFIIFAVTALAFCEKSPEEGSAFEGDMELDPDQMAALMEQMSKQGKGSAFASIKAGLWLTNGKPDNIKYYIDPQISGATSAIEAAVGDYHKYTCLRFFKQTRRPSVLIFSSQLDQVAHHLSVDDQVAIISDLHVDVGEKEQSFMKLDIQSVYSTNRAVQIVIITSLF